ncbi:succinate dehydrogenase, cytochrome b556 subunit [Polaromonas sp.]|uniref:succinate dehydrogenase, cytochrome b556 subunit n=1 Tax=Polaromonas sp. TaxID=1869339 RepID=UPI0013B614D1|nr:succinate dehydrogenase, cytochrome b556 subunit [Polaromonas sp.]NDP63293.1 succinate dehydrogenase, cytochrome b556 subunit [Polaromonas sp.]
MKHSSRPVFLNLLQIKMPVGALTSITHRVTGVLLAASVPVLVYLLELSLRSEQGFDDATGLFGHPAIKAVVFIELWALTHHMLAGIRHLLTDMSVGSTFVTARRSAWWVNVGGLAAALVAAGVWL